MVEYSGELWSVGQKTFYNALAPYVNGFFPDPEGFYVHYCMGDLSGDPESDYKDAATATYCDPKTGASLKSFGIQLGCRHEGLPHTGCPVISRTVEEFRYTPIIYGNPYLPKQIEAEEMWARVWNVDRLGRKRKDLLLRTVSVPPQNWTPERVFPRGLGLVLEQGVYESLNRGEWEEWRRVFFVNGVCGDMIVYVKDANGILQLLLFLPRDWQRELAEEAFPDVDPASIIQELSSARLVRF